METSTSVWDRFDNLCGEENQDRCNLIADVWKGMHDADNNIDFAAILQPGWSCLSRALDCAFGLLLFYMPSEMVTLGGGEAG